MHTHTHTHTYTHTHADTHAHNSCANRAVLKSRVARLVGKFQSCLCIVWSSLPGRPNYVESASSVYTIYNYPRRTLSLSHDDLLHVLSPPFILGPLCCCVAQIRVLMARSLACTLGEIRNPLFNIYIRRSVLRLHMLPIGSYVL